MIGITAEQRREYREQRAREHAERFACLEPECSAVMEFVVMLQEGNGQGVGEVNLFQCPACKRIATFNSTQ